MQIFRFLKNHIYFINNLLNYNILFKFKKLKLLLRKDNT